MYAQWGWSHVRGNSLLCCIELVSAGFDTNPVGVGLALFSTVPVAFIDCSCATTYPRSGPVSTPWNQAGSASRHLSACTVPGSQCPCPQAAPVPIVLRITGGCLDNYHAGEAAAGPGLTTRGPGWSGWWGWLPREMVCQLIHKE